MNGKKDSIVNIKGAFKDMLTDYKIDSKYNAVLIKKSWEKIMGRPIAQRTKKITLYNKILRVEVDSAALKNELNMSKSKVLALLVKEYGSELISEVIFT